MDQRRNFARLAAVFNIFVQLQSENLYWFQTAVNPILKSDIKRYGKFLRLPLQDIS